MKRDIAFYLLEWKSSERRKPLLLRGARQVGKTWAVRELGRTYDYFCEVNFEETPEVRIFFEGNLTPSPVLEKLSVYYGVPIIPGKTLLFFDEIQACENAIRILRFFYEKAPDIHVAAAGSLLEFALESIPSFGVGRIQSLYMYPLSFSEFLTAMNEDSLLKIIEKSNADNPIDSPFFHRLIELYRTYSMIGGFPEVVADYISNRDINGCMDILDSLISNFEDDFGKYKTRVPGGRLQDVFRALPIQAGAKFVYKKVSEDLHNIQIKDALDLLIKAGLAYKILHSNGQGLPLGAGADQKKFKTILCDVGLYHRLSGLDIREILTADSAGLINKGASAEVFTGTELMSYSSPHRKNALYYWHREARNSNAEVDYLIVHNGKIIPLEVKAGTKGSMKSLRIFLDSHNSAMGIRLSLENFSVYENIHVYPLFALSLFRD